MKNSDININSGEVKHIIDIKKLRGKMDHGQNSGEVKHTSNIKKVVL